MFRKCLVITVCLTVFATVTPAVQAHDLETVTRTIPAVTRHEPIYKDVEET